MNPLAQETLNTIERAALVLGQSAGSHGGGSVTVVVELGPETMNRLDRIVAALEAIRSPNPSSETGRPDIASTAPEYLSKEAAAQFLGVPTKTIEYLVSSRKLRYIQVGSQRGRVIPIEELRRFANQNTVLTAEEMLKKRRRT